MTGQNVSYIMVSSYDQNTERQLEGLAVDREFKEKASSGKDTERPVLKTCLEHLRGGEGTGRGVRCVKAELVYGFG